MTGSEWTSAGSRHVSRHPPATHRGTVPPRDRGSREYSVDLLVHVLYTRYSTAVYRVYTSTPSSRDVTCTSYAAAGGRGAPRTAPRAGAGVRGVPHAGCKREKRLQNGTAVRLLSVGRTLEFRGAPTRVPPDTDPGSCPFRRGCAVQYKCRKHLILWPLQSTSPSPTT